MATSAMAMTTPISVEAPVRWLSSPPIGLVCVVPTSCAWIEMGLELRKNVRIGELLEPGEHEGHAEEQTER